MSLCIRYRGEVVLDRAIGHARGNEPGALPNAQRILATPDTLFNFYSGSKSITHLLTILLDEKGELSIDDRVADYFPEFAKHAKGQITLRHVLTHRAGVPVSPGTTLDPSILKDSAAVSEALVELRPQSSAGAQQAYHALTGGFILGEVLRRATGKSLPELLDEHLRGPLGLSSFTYGVEDPAAPHVAVDAFTGPDPLPPEAAAFHRAFGLSVQEIVDIANDPRFRTAVVPSANIFSTADDVSRVFETLRCDGLHKGEQVLPRAAVRRARQPSSGLQFDHMLLLPLRYSPAFMLGSKYFSLYGPGSADAFGHLGFTNVLGWADPQREISVGFMNSGKPFLTVKLLAWLNISRIITSVFPRLY
jgi:CubicO group peptidase (beta-lactamase class C family)